MAKKHHALTEAQAAERLGIAAATLRNWRQRNEGPVFHRFGRTVRYLEADLEAYILANVSQPSKLRESDK